MSAWAIIVLILVGLIVCVVVYDLAPAPARDSPQLPDHRALPVPARGGRAGAAPVHRHRQRRRAPVQPEPAPLGLHVGQARGQHVRLRHRQRLRAQPGLPDHPPRRVPGTGTRRSSTGRTTRCPARRSWAPHAVAGTRSGRPSIVSISGMSFGALSGARSRPSTPASSSPDACRTPARADSRSTTSRAGS